MNKKETFGEKIMIGGAITGRGALPLFKVPHNVKGNSHYYVSDVLKPLLDVEGQKRYGEDTSNVYVHHDATIKSPDESPVDFFGLGILKKNLFNRRASTLKGLWKVGNEEWNSKVPSSYRFMEAKTDFNI
ncbi:unnamed protein product [Allacma fusca]|uniref:Uncharacterized protein n=1 Tax=Allacma fusca TaxID=39272 RepID=A0A8J2JLA3_9HEXA|nr:unnamed protein product [Allacma fusca]